MKPIQVISALGSQVTVASDYTKKKNVLRIALNSGAEYLMQSESPDEMSLWIQKIRTSVADANPAQENAMAVSPQRTNSMNISTNESPSQETPPKKEKKRTSLFSKKRKSRGDLV